MKTSETPNTIIANEILSALDSTVLSSESKNSILVDYLHYMHKTGFEDGQKALVDEVQSFKKGISTKDDSKEGIIGEIGKQLLEIDHELEEKYNNMR